MDLETDIITMNSGVAFRNLSNIMLRAERGKVTIIALRHEPRAVVIPLAMWAKLQRLAEQEADND